MRTLALQACTLLAVGAFAADDNLVNLIVAGTATVGAIFAFQKWVESKIDHKLNGVKQFFKMEMRLLRMELGLKLREHEKEDKP